MSENVLNNLITQAALVLVAIVAAIGAALGRKPAKPKPADDEGEINTDKMDRDMVRLIAHLVNAQMAQAREEFTAQIAEITKERDEALAREAAAQAREVAQKTRADAAEKERDELKTKVEQLEARVEVLETELGHRPRPMTMEGLE